MFNAGNILHLCTEQVPGVWGQVGAVHVSDCLRCSMSFSFHRVIVVGCIQLPFSHSPHLEISAENSCLLTESGLKSLVNLAQFWHLRGSCNNSVKEPWTWLCLLMYCTYLFSTDVVPKRWHHQIYTNLLVLNVGPVMSNAMGGTTARNSTNDWQILGWGNFPT